jgi:stage II sporulation protein D
MMVSFSAGAATPPRVLVRLQKSVSQLTLSGNKIRWQKNKESGVSPDLQNPTSESYAIRLRQQKGRPIWQLKGESTESHEVLGKRLALVGQNMKLQNRLSPSHLHLVAKGDSLFDVIADLKIDEYLKGVLPSEMPASWPIEALKAQVVASRSYTLFNLEHRQDRKFHLESSVLDQVYHFSHPAHGLVEASAKIQQAIEETKGWVLVNHTQQVIPAYFHADCGGRTETAQAVWSNGRKTATVRDEFCPLSPNAIWQYEVTREELQKRLSKVLPAPLKGLDRLYLSGRTQSGRVKRVILLDKQDRRREVSAQLLRKALGYNRMKSTLFYVQNRPDKILIYGRGHGHGVGLCQYGTRFLASRGLGFKKILKHYYPNAELVWRPQAVRSAAGPKVGVSKNL